MRMGEGRGGGRPPAVIGHIHVYTACLLSAEHRQGLPVPASNAADSTPAQANGAHSAPPGSASAAAAAHRRARRPRQHGLLQGDACHVRLWRLCLACRHEKRRRCGLHLLLGLLLGHMLHLVLLPLPLLVLLRAACRRLALRRLPLLPPASQAGVHACTTRPRKERGCVGGDLCVGGTHVRVAFIQPFIRGSTPRCSCSRTHVRPRATRPLARPPARARFSSLPDALRLAALPAPGPSLPLLPPAVCQPEYASGWHATCLAPLTLPQSTYLFSSHTPHSMPMIRPENMPRTAARPPACQGLGGGAPPGEEPMLQHKNVTAMTVQTGCWQARGSERT